MAARAHATFTRALGLEESQREAWVREACAGDAALEARVRRLLTAAARSAGFLEAPALAHPTQDSLEVPDAVGDYLVIGVLGTGGMATVYEAVQDNPKRRVALKVMHRALSRTDALLRFRLEAETLARLHHPGIAQIYEAGTARLGQATSAPFFAMELVADALSITDYADRHQLSLRARLTMFAAVCDAIHYGHQHGVIHRDLKPGNVLVDGEGRARVIDFGVARTIESSGKPLTAVSSVPQLIGTLNYMSPEQCHGAGDVDIRTDVYSLGVMLYELTCGRLPHDLSALPIPAAVQEIVHAPPRRLGLPSTRMHRDLEAIVLMAMAKQPDRRYPSAAALASDVRRLLNFQPIEARPPGLIDHCRLFARRHRALVAAGLVLAASITLIALISTGFAVRLSEEVTRRRDAEQKTARERDAAQWEAYIAQIAGALSAMNSGEFEQMRTRLTAAAQRYHGWEWGFLSRLAERSSSVIVGHDAMIMDLATSPDSTRTVTAASDGTVKLWAISDQRLLATYESESRTQSRSACFSADGLQVITGDDDGIVRLLDGATLSSSEVIAHLPTAVRSVIGLPSNRIAVATDDGAARVWTLEPLAVMTFPADQPGGIHGLAASPDGRMLATYSNQGHIWLRSADDLSVLQRLTFPGGVNQVRFSRDGRLIAAAGARSTVLVWNTGDGTLAQQLQVTYEVNSVRSLAFSGDQSMLAVGLTHRGIVVCAMSDGRVIGELGGHTDAVTGLIFDAVDERLVSSSWDRTIRTWRTSEFESPSGMLTLKGHRDYVRGVAFSPDGATLASVSEDGDVRLWDPDLAAPIARVPIGSTKVNAVEFSRDGRVMALASADGLVRVVESVSGQVVMEFKSDGRSVASLAFDSRGDCLATGNEDGTVRLWDLRAGEQRLELNVHKARVNSIRFSPDGRTLATGSRDRTVALIDALTGAEIHRLTAHTSDVFAVLFHPNGRELFTGSRDQTVRVWNVETGVCLRTLRGHGQYVTCLALNPAGTRLAAGSWFGEIVLFDLSTFDQIASFRAHEAAIRGVAFSPDGRWLASGSYDSTVRLFDSATRIDADAARGRAVNARMYAERSVQSALGEGHLPPTLALTRLREAGLDPVADPWVRKIVLSHFARPGHPTPP